MRINSPSSSSSSSPSATATRWRRLLCVVCALGGQAAILYKVVVAPSPTSSSASASSSSMASSYLPLLSPLGGVESSHLRGIAGTSSSNEGIGAYMMAHNPVAIPPGQPPNLPRIEVRVHGNAAAGATTTPQADEITAESRRGIYGGKGDGKHLGGFTEFDPHGVAPGVWAKMITELGVKSMMDVGCGKGVSSRWFLEHNVKVLCVEGSHDAVSQSFLPPDRIVEHDYSRGPWWPADTYDAAWSVEFLEHVSRQYMHNYIQTLRKAAILFVTSSRWGGWHHVEIHHDEWWIRKFSSYGFVYDEKLTQTVRKWAKRETAANYTLPTGENPNPQHVTLSMKVFLNPAVAALPQHGHLFPEDGCLGRGRSSSEMEPGWLRFAPRRCGTGPQGVMETPLAESFVPLTIDRSMHERWVEAIKASLTVPQGQETTPAKAKAKAKAKAVVKEEA